MIFYYLFINSTSQWEIKTKNPQLNNLPKGNVKTLSDKITKKNTIKLTKELKITPISSVFFFSDLDEYLYEVPNFSKNLLQLFPNALTSPEEYFEMVTYLRRYEPSIKINKQADENAK